MQRTLLAGLFSATLFFSINSYSAPSLPDNNQWQIDISPYLWAMNMNGTVQVATARGHVNQSFTDILEHLNAAGMLWVDARKDKFGIFVNALYASLSDNANDGPLSVQVKNIFALYSAGVSYDIYHSPQNNFSISPYLGVRYTENNTRVTLQYGSFNVRATDNQHWVDPIIGVRFNMAISRGWKGVLAGDVGGTNTSNQYSYNIMGLLGYKPETRMKNTTWYFGYRLLDQHYVNGSGVNYFNWNMKLFGPMLGVAITL